MEVRLLEIPWIAPSQWARSLNGMDGIAFLSSPEYFTSHSRYSIISANPIQVFSSFGNRCLIKCPGQTTQMIDSPWRILQELQNKYHLTSELQLPFPTGGWIGYWGYDLKNSLEKHMLGHKTNDLGLPDCWLGLYPSLLVFDHLAERSWIVASGIDVKGEQSDIEAQQQVHFWRKQMDCLGGQPAKFRKKPIGRPLPFDKCHSIGRQDTNPILEPPELNASFLSNMTRQQFISAVEKVLNYIQAGDVYQLNLSHRLTAEWTDSAWNFFEALMNVSPAPYSAYLNCDGFALASASPELFLKISDRHIQTHPIKGTRPRGDTPEGDAHLSRELQSSPKENAELLMITDLLRNDLGRICQYGSIRVPELIRLEHYPEVHHLVSKIEGLLRPEISHLDALSACFPGGSITGAPKIRAIQIIDALETTARGPYTGCLGYLGFNGESQWNLLIRTAILLQGKVHFQVGAGIVADSNAAAEYMETWHKARGFMKVIHRYGEETQQPNKEMSGTNPILL